MDNIQQNLNTPKNQPRKSSYQIQKQKINQPTIGTSTQNQVLKLFASQKYKLEYEPDQIPPNFDISEIHRKALMVGPADKNQDEICPCCGLKVQRQIMEITCNIKDLSFLGPGYPLFFEFQKYCLLIIFLIMLVSGWYSMISNITGKSCDKKDSDCESDPIVIFTIGNSHDKNSIMKVQIFLNFLSIILVFILLQFYRKFSKETDVQCDNTDVSANDYAVFIHNIPTDFKIDREDQDYDEELKDKLTENLFENKKADIVEVVMCYDVDELEQLQKEKKQLIKIKQEQLKFKFKQNKNQQVAPDDQNLSLNKEKENSEFIEKQNISQEQENKENQNIDQEEQNNDTNNLRALKKLGQNLQVQHNIKQTNIYSNTLNEIDSDIKNKNIQIQNLQEKFYDGRNYEFMKKYFTGRALVLFQTEQEKDEVIKTYHHKLNLVELLSNQKQFKFHGNILKFEEAPYPSDIYWRNLKFGTQEQFQRRLITLLIHGLILFIFFWIYYALLEWQHYYPKDSTQSDIMSIFRAIIISLLNFVIISIVQFLANYEGHHTRTGSNISVTRKVALAMFINTSLLIFLLQIYILPEGNSNFVILFQSGGLIHSIYFVFISNMVIPIIFIFVNPNNILRKLLKYKEIQKKEKQSSYKTQQQLNDLFEESEFKVQIESARIITVMYNMSFYTPIMPFSAVYTFITIVLLYWTNKYVLLRQRQVKFSQSSQLSEALTDLVEYILPIFSLSYIIFYDMLTDQNTLVFIFGTIGIALGVLHAFLPMSELNEKIFGKIEATPNEETYDQVKDNFRTNYAQQNPATSLIYQQIHAKKLQKLKNQQQNQPIDISNNSIKQLRQTKQSVSNGSVSPSTLKKLTLNNNQDSVISQEQNIQQDIELNVQQIN